MPQKTILMTQEKQLGITGILREAFGCLHSNPKLLSSSLLLVLVPLNHLRQLPTLNPPFVLNAPLKPSASTSNYTLYINLIIISLLTEFIAVYFSVIAYNGRNLRIKELQSKCKRTWKGSVITLLCARFILFASRVFLHKMEAYRARVELIRIIFSVVHLFGGAIFLSYVGFVAKVSQVVSIVEEGCYGLPALRRAGSLVGGRKLHGFVLMVLRFMFVEGVFLVIGAIAVDRRGNGWQLSVISNAAAAILLRSFVLSLSSLYTHLIYMVYYYECSHDKGRCEEEQLIRVVQID